MPLKSEFVTKDDIERRFFPEQYQAKRIERARQRGRAWELGRSEVRQEHSAGGASKKKSLPGTTKSGFSHSLDYRSIRFKGKLFEPTRNQATMIKVLHEAFQQGHPAVAKETLVAAIGSETSRVRDSFRKSPLWGTLLVPGKRRGTFRLNIN